MLGPELPSPMSGRGLSVFPLSPHLHHGGGLPSRAFRDMAVPSGLSADFSTVIQSAWAMLIGLTINTDTVSFAAQMNSEKGSGRDMEMVEPRLKQVEVTIDKKKTLAELMSLIEARVIAAQDVFEQTRLPCILQLDPCRPDQLPSEVCKTAADAAREQGPETCSAVVIVCAWNASQFSIACCYDDKFLQQREIDQILDQFAHLVDVLSCSDGEVILGQLQICGPGDMFQIQQWNQNCPEAVMKLAHEVIASQVDRRPDAIAVSAWDAQLTYRELDDFSGNLAQRLLALGVGPDSLIPFCFEKSAWAIVAMLGILKAGAAFVALDPEHPLERLSSIVERIQAKVLLTSETNSEKMRALKSSVIVVSESDLAQPDQPKGYPSDVTPLNLAYVIFTSGSTGTPKGVMIEHHSLVQSCLTLGARMGSADETRMLQFSSFTFDASILEIFPTLFHGGCVCMPSDSDRADNLVSYVNDSCVDIVFLTPSIAGFVDPKSIPKVQTLVTGGEAFSGDTLKYWLETRKVLNAYGPSEITIACNIAQLTMAEPTKRIGHAISTVSWIVDPDNHARLMPLGCIGELLVQGQTLARGYLQDERKTKSVFIEAPDWYKSVGMPNAPARLYKTGDLVRYEPDGSLLYIGRKDSQVKIRGQRVELGEIEHHISTTGMVEQASVLFPSSGALKSRLVGILVLEGDAKVSFDGQIRPLGGDTGPKIEQVRSLLLKILPRYMVPTHLIAIQALPLLPSGKFDRKSLVQWVENIDGSILTTPAGQILPESRPVSGIEGSLQRIVGEVLNIPAEQVGLQQSYLSLGGDSISAMQIVNRCRAKGMELATKNILGSSSISEMALQVRLSIIQKTDDYNEETDAEFGLSPMQRIYFSLVPRGDNEFNQSFLLKLRGNVDDRTINRAIKAVVERHSMLRARFTRREGDWVQYISKDTEGSYILTSHRIRGPDNVHGDFPHSALLVNAETGPLLAADIITTETEVKFLRLTAHHLVIDLVSWRIILHDLEEYLAHGMLNGGKPLSFQTWMHLQNEHSSSAILPPILRSFEYAPPNLEYWGITDKPLSSADNHTHSFMLSVELTELVMKSCHTSLRTNPVDIMLAALLFSFKSVFNDRPLPTVFDEGHGRNLGDEAIDVSRTVGWFTVLFPVLVTAEKEETIVDMIRRVKDFRRTLAGHEITFFQKQFLKQDGSHTKNFPVEILFNFFGQYQQLERADAILQQVSNGITEDLGRQALDVAIFEMSVQIERAQLRFALTHGKKLNHQTKIREWMGEFASMLEIAVHELRAREHEYTLSDFPMLELDYQTLDTLVNTRLKELLLRSNQGLAIDDVYPCTPMQDGILASQATNPRLYRSAIRWKVTASNGAVIDCNRLLDAWSLVVQRHSILRTAFIPSFGQQSLFNQVVFNGYQPRTSLLYCDEGGEEGLFGPQDAVDESLEGTLTHEHEFTVYSISPTTAFCQLSINHALFDGASVEVLLRDLTLGYQYELDPQFGPLYKDYVRYVSQRSHDADQSYWRNYLADCPACHFPFSEGPQADYAEHAITLDSSLVQDIRKFCVQRELTTANVFQFAWALVLRALTGSDSVSFGCLTSGRDVPVNGILDAVGAFMNMLVCRFEMEREDSLIQLLETSTTHFRQSLEHQHMPLAEVHSLLGLQGKHLFNTAISFQKTSRQDALREIQIQQLPDSDPSEYDVTLNVCDSPASVDLAFRYWKSRISDQQMEITREMFVAALSLIVNDPSQKIEHVNISEAQYNQIFEWNKTIPSPTDRCLHEIVHSVAEKYPLQEAVFSSQESWTYQQLDSLSSALANKLTAVGVAPETLVPICFEKSIWAIVAMLGVMKAGGAFVPLDPKHPPERHLAIMKDVNARLVLGSSVTSIVLRSYVQTVLEVSRDTISPDLSTISAHTERAVSPSNVAYIIFTSGSTGKPKGVVIEHRAVSSSCTEHAVPMGFTSSSRVLQFSSYTFDASIAEIFTTLITVGTVCVPTDQERMGNIVPFINHARVNWIFSTPSFIRTVEPTSVPTVRTLAVGGEILGQDILSTWTPHVTFIHVYGPTECCIFSVSHTVNRDEEHRVILGRAFGCVSWIVDPNNPEKLSPLGSVGELLLQGPILARGYLHNAEKTAAAFMKSPAWLGGEHQRMYRTGDLVRYNLDGTMMYIGRKDNQVKLRGQRLELGEIEYNMSLNLPERTAVAVDIVDRAGMVNSKALAAFVCDDARCTDFVSDQDLFDSMTGQFRSQMEDLRQRLEKSLPPYMVPSMYIHLKKMPPTPTGKLDRALLRRLVAELSQEDQSIYSLKTGEVTDSLSTRNEMILQEFWGKVLRTELTNIGARSNFFHLGGDSIAALHLVNLVRNKNLSIEVPAIFENPTLRSMALHLKSEKAVAMTALEAFELVEPPNSRADLIDRVSQSAQVQPELILDMYPCTPLQEGLVALSNKKSGAYISQFVYGMAEHIDTERFKDAWALTVAETSIMRTRIIALEGSVWQVVILEDIQWEHGKSLEAYLAQDQKLDMQPQSPLARYALIQEGDNRYFVLTMHHSIYDGWSLPLLFQEVERNYHQDSTDHFRPEFNTFIQHVTETNREKSRKFWGQLLTGAKQSRFPQPLNPEYQFVVDRSLKIPIELKAEPLGDFTISSILQAAWAIILSQYTESSDITFGSVVSGRNAPVHGVSDIIGPTVATVPVRVKLNRKQPISELLHNIQDQATQRILFEQEGLQNMSLISNEAHIACQFLSLFVIQPLSVHSGTLLGCEQVNVDYNSARATPLTIECSIGDGKLEIAAHFDSNLVSESKMELVIHQLAHIFHEISSGHQRPLLDITQCSNYEKRIIQKWNDKIHPAMETCVHHLFKKHALAWPKAPAIHAWDYQLTYAEVDQYAMAFAHYVANLGVGPEVLVPIIMDKSAWTIVSMIGILKAGGACAALDPSHPSDRLRGIIQDTASPVMVVSPQYENRFLGLVENTIVINKGFLDELPSKTVDPQSTVCYSNAAFVIFTSGSTGKPKGIVIEHVNICTSSEAHGSAMNVGLDSRVFSFASYAFDVSLGDTWTTLMRGGCVCVPSENDRLNNLAQTVTEMRANWLGLTPTVSRLLTPELVPTVKVLSLGGEPLAKEDTATWADHVRVFNFYGPAETVIGATLCDLSADRTLNPRTLGHGIDANLWVVNPDNYHALAPIGTIGELLIQGPAISRGYLKDPERTSRSYLTENPAFLTETDFGPNRTQKIFKTGDLVYQNPDDGAIVYIGRKDTQVKLHGQRIELQEIEEHLVSHCDEEHTWIVELIQGPGTESAHLAAFFTSHSAIGKKDMEAQVLTLAKDMRERLRKLKKTLTSLLPKYMVPSLFIPLSTMPLNTSGKTDRLRLRALGADISSNEAGFTPFMLSETPSKSMKPVKGRPATKKGQKMQELWSRVLKLPLNSIGSVDNFFDLGGNSIMAMKLASAAHAEGISLSVADIFKHPHLDDISNKVAILTAPKPRPSPVPKAKLNHALKDFITQQVSSYGNIQYAEEATDYQAWTAIHGMMRHKGFYNDLFIDFNDSVNVLRIREACHILVRHNPILRAAFVGHEDRILLVGFKEVAVDFQYYTQDVQTDTGAPPSWEQEAVKYGKPPVRFALIQRPNTTHRLVIRISHAHYDGISVPLLLDDLVKAYTKRLGVPRSNYFNFLEHYANLDKTPHLAFWKELLHGSSITQIVSHKGLHYTGPVNSSICKTITAPSLHSGTGVTTATIFKAAWALVLSTLSGDKDITFGHITAGRNSYLSRFDDAIGAFLNIVPVRAKLNNTPNTETSLQFMQALQAQHVESLPHECIGWRSILKSCTSWPSWAGFSSILQHQNLDNASEAPLSGIARIGASVDMWVLTIPNGDEVDVQLYFSSHIPELVAQQMLDTFCTATQKLCEPEYADAPVGNCFLNSQALIPITPLPSCSKPDIDISSQEAENAEESSKQFNDLRHVVETAWNKILGSSKAKNGYSLSDSYLDFGGDLVTAGLLAHAFQMLGYQRVTVEDMIDWPTIRGQIECLARDSTK